MTEQETQAKAVQILILGVLSVLLCGFITGLPAWIMGKKALEDMPMSETQATMVLWGRGLGAFSVIASGCFLILFGPSVFAAIK